MKEDIVRVKVDVPIRDLWKAISSDLRHIVPKVLPNIVKEVELLEGDGGQGSILLFNFHPDVAKASYQKEKIVELDESLYQMTRKTLEGGHLDDGFSSYMTSFKLIQVSETETLVEVKFLYESEAEDTSIPTGTLQETVDHYYKCLENYLSNSGS